MPDYERIQAGDIKVGDRVARARTHNFQEVTGRRLGGLLMARPMTDEELARAIVQARNRRDAYAHGRAPERVLRELRMLLNEQTLRRVGYRDVGL